VQSIVHFDFEPLVELCISALPRACPRRCALLRRRHRAVPAHDAQLHARGHLHEECQSVEAGIECAVMSLSLLLGNAQRKTTRNLVPACLDDTSIAQRRARILLLSEERWHKRTVVAAPCAFTQSTRQWSAPPRSFPQNPAGLDQPVCSPPPHPSQSSLTCLQPPGLGALRRPDAETTVTRRDDMLQVSL
jgi:hypothetical protein